MSLLIKYVNCINEEIILNQSPYYVGSNDLRDYSLEYDTDNKIISNFRRKIAEKKLPIYIVGCKASDRDRLYEVFQADVNSEIPGTLYVGEYSYRCYIVGATNDETTYMNCLYKEFKIVSATNVWNRSVGYHYNIDDKKYSPVDTKDYEYGYEYDYCNGLESRQIMNEFGTPCGFNIVFYGPVNNPSISIGGNIYKVNTAVSEGEYLTITCIGDEKTVILTKNNGEKVNKFSNRSKEQSVFTKIPRGNNPVTWDGSFAFDIITIDERSEPAWT